MQTLTRFVTYTLIGWVAFQVAAARATINEQQEHRAEVICLQTPNACGLGDGSGAPMDF